MRRVFAVLGVLSALLFVALPGAVAPALAQSDEQTAPIEVRSIDATGFPLVRAVVAGPSITGNPDDAFLVVEDGQPLPIDAIRLRTDELNVVVTIDVSGSMEGEPIAQAKTAVRDLLANLPDDVPVSVVSFGASAQVTHEFSTDRASILGAVDGLAATGGTALFDGIDLAMTQLEATAGASALVVLADGNDSASTTPPAQVVERLDGSGIRASFVALQTPDLEYGTFEFLADASGGSAVAVEQATQFSEVFAEIGAGLGGSFELRWTSRSQGSSAEVAIALASAPDAAVTRTFEHAEVQAFVPDIADEIVSVPESDSIFSASWIPIAAALGVSAGLVILVAGLRTSAGAVERREAKRAEKDQKKTEGGGRRVGGGVQDRLNDLSAQLLRANNRGRSLDETLDRAGLAMRSNEFVVACAAVLFASVFVGILLFGVPYFLAAVVIAALGIPAFLQFRIGRRAKKFSEQLGDTLQLMAGSLSAGYGLGQTLDSVAREAESPTSEEFQRVVMETRLGRSLEDSLMAMSERLGVKDFDWVVDAIKIQSSVGGNLSEIIQQVGETIRARTRIRRQVDALTAEGKISALVLFCLPIGLLGFIFATNPSYVTPMFSSGLGQALLGAAVVMLSIGGLWLKKLVTPEF